MNKYIKLCALLCLGALPFVTHASQISVDKCDIASGITIEKFKQELSIKYNPKLIYTEENRPKNFTDQMLMRTNKQYYHFEEIGIWVFFDMQGILKTIRIEAPFSAPIDGVHIGDNKELLFELKGKPDSDDENGVIYRSGGGYVNYKTMRGKIYQAFTDRCSYYAVKNINI